MKKVLKLAAALLAALALGAGFLACSDDDDGGSGSGGGTQQGGSGGGASSEIDGLWTSTFTDEGEEGGEETVTFGLYFYKGHIFEAYEEEDGSWIYEDEEMYDFTYSNGTITLISEGYKAATGKVTMSGNTATIEWTVLIDDEYKSEMEEELNTAFKTLEKKPGVTPKKES